MKWKNEKKNAFKVIFFESQVNQHNTRTEKQNFEIS